MLKSMIRKLVKWSILEDDREDESYSKSPQVACSSNKVKHSNLSAIHDYNRGMHFTVFNATGGKIIELTSYDVRTDSTSSTLYVITDQENLGEEIGQIITRENLTR